MPNTQKTKIHGVEVTQVNYQGKWYTPVAGRVQIAEHADPVTIRRKGHGYHVVSVQIIQVGDQWAYHCMVEYPVGSGVIRPGTDFIDLNDKKAGIAKAETSAIGRALGLHGIASEDSIASADEMSRVSTAFAPEMDEGERVVDTPVERRPTDTRQRTPQPHTAAQTNNTPASTSDTPAPPQRETRTSATTPADDPMALTHASALDQKRLYGQLAARRLHENGGFLRNVTGREIDMEHLRDGRSDLSVHELNRANERLTRMAVPAGQKEAAR